MIEAISTHKFSEGDRLYLDSSVLILLWAPPLKGDRRVGVYSIAWSAMVKSRCQIYLNSITLSEFVHGFVRRVYGVSPDRKAYPTLKSFRQHSSQYRNALPDLYSSLDALLAVATLVESPADSSLFMRQVRSRDMESADFSDIVIADQCRNLRLTVVSDDADFASLPVSLLTGNEALLSPSAKAE